MCDPKGEKNHGSSVARDAKSGYSTLDSSQVEGKDRIQGEMVSKGRVVTRRFFHRLVAIENLHA